MQVNEAPDACELCGQEYHSKPLPTVYNLTCPGETAELSEQESFLAVLARTRSVATKFGEVFASDPDKVAEYCAREMNFAERFAKDEDGNPKAERSFVTPEQLRAHAASYTKAVMAKVATESLLEEVAFEPDKPLSGLVIERRIEDVRTSVPDAAPLSHKAGKRYGDDSDYGFFLGGEDQ